MGYVPCRLHNLVADVLYILAVRTYAICHCDMVF